MPPHRRPVNLMFQSYALFPHMTVAKNVAYGLERERLPRARSAAAWARCWRPSGWTRMAGRNPQQLSGGQRQRVALARAIVKRPRLLLLDEPLSALDKKVRAEMQLELKRLQHEVGITFVVVTHDQEEAMSLADRIAVFERRAGCSRWTAPVELYERPRTPFVADFVGANNLFEGTACGGRRWTVTGLGVLPGRATAGASRGARAARRPAGEDRAREGRPRRAPGHVVDVSFYGGVSHVSVEVPGRVAPVLVAAQGASARCQAGSSVVTLRWSPRRRSA